MRRFELVDGKSSKFWHIAVEGSTQIVRYGRIGTDGQEKSKDFPDAGAAKAATDKLIAAKTKKGYAEVGASAVKSPTTTEKSPTNSPGAAVSSSANAAISKETLQTLRSLALPTRRRPEGSVAHMAYIDVHPYEGVKLEETFLAFSKGTIRSHPGVFLREFVKLDEAEATKVRKAVEARFEEALASWERQGTHAGLCAFLLQDDERIVRALYERTMAESGMPDGMVAAALNGLSDVDQLVAFVDKVLATGYWSGGVLNQLDPITLLTQCGTSAVPLLIRLASREFDSRGVDNVSDVACDRTLLALAYASTPESARYLLRRGEERIVFPLLVTACEASPRIMMNACLEHLARSPNHALATDLAGRMLRADPRLAEHAQTETQKLIAASLLKGPPVPSAELPSSLRAEPWKGLKPLVRPQVAGLSAPEREESIHWPKGVREEWTEDSESDKSYWLRMLFSKEFNQTHRVALSSKEGRDALLEELVAHVGDGSELDPVERFVKNLASLTGYLADDRKTWGPFWLSQTDPRISLPMWNAIHPGHWKITTGAARRVVAAYGIDALDSLLARAGFQEVLADVFGSGKPGTVGPLLEASLYIASPRLVAPMAQGLSGREGRKAARRWLLAHPELSAEGLVPIALSAGRDKKDKTPDGAVTGLQILANEGHRGLIERAAKAQSNAAFKAVTQILDASPYALKKAPRLPKWLEVSRLAPIVTNDGKSLDEAATTIVLGMLAASTDEGAYPALEEVQAHCTTESLDAFAWSLFREWAWADAPSKDKWALSALGWLGDEKVCRNLATLMVQWPSDGLSARAKVGVEVLARIGSERALMALYQFSEKAKTKGLKAAAKEKVEEIAEALEMSTDELADRLVPDLGLDADGTLEFEVGTDDSPLTLKIGLDTHLAPYPMNGEGERLAKFPGASGAFKGADKAKLKEANKAFKALAKDAKAVAKHALARLESAMVRQRSWPLNVARRCFFDHPVMRSAAAAVLWTSDSGPFRVAEDRSFADLNDDALTLASDALVRVYHPAAVDKTVRATASELLADYELLQPFAQVGRPVYTASEFDLAQWNGREVASRRLFALESYGWKRDTDDASKTFNVRGSAKLTYSPGLSGGPDASPTQRLGTLELDVKPAELDPIDASELIHDMMRVCAE